jgi:hypothetical protein
VRVAECGGSGTSAKPRGVADRAAHRKFSPFAVFII